jgi:hypothetical protein
LGEDIKKVEYQKKDRLDTDVQSRVDMQFNVGIAIDVPHMRMTVSATDHLYSIYLDYIPRVELLASMDYFDKYFENVEASCSAELERGIADGIVTIKGQPGSVLSKMLQSPFALSIDVDKKGGNFVKEICTNYISRWCDWIAIATNVYQEELLATQLEQAVLIDIENSVDTDSMKEIKVLEQLVVQDVKKSKVVSMYERDQSIQKLLFESQKYELAKIMGVDFSPKAAELSAAIVGPSIGSASYSLF